MVMLSTRQQITNWLVYLHFRPKRVVALSSKVARDGGWCVGMKHVLGERFCELGYEEREDVGGFVEEFGALLEGVLGDGVVDEEARDGRVVWAWGGGQKPHSAALREVAQGYLRNEEGEVGGGARHVLAYAGGRSGSLMCEGEPRVRLRGRVRVEEVLKIHGLCPSSGERAEGAVASRAEVEEFFGDQEVRRRMWEVPSYVVQVEEMVESGILQFGKLQSLFFENFQNKKFFEELLKALGDIAKEKRGEKGGAENAGFQAARQMMGVLGRGVNRQMLFQALKQLRVVRLSEVEGDCEEGENRAEKKRVSSGEAFERLARRCVLDWRERYAERMEREGKEDRVCDVRFGVEVKPAGREGEFDFEGNERRVVAEFDCLLATKEGRLMALDFKSAGRPGPWREQLFSIQNAGGRYAELFYLYPWIEEDLRPSKEAGGESVDERPEEIRRRMDSIQSMDEMLAQNPFARGRKSGVRLYSEPERFDEELEVTLGLRTRGKG